MDKLQWFKFSYADWRMGKIQRCSEITQARFINLCCLYWSKESNLTLEDAEIEIDKEHLDVLLKKKIIESDGEIIFIKFLDEQLIEITETSKDKSNAAKARWDKYRQSKKEKETNADAMQVHTNALQNDAEESREEETRVEKSREDTNILTDGVLKYYHGVCNQLPKVKDFSTSRKKMIIARAKEHGKDKVKEVLDNVSTSDFLNGINNKGWNADFNFIFNKQNFIKILEGNYKNKSNGKNRRKIDINEFESGIEAEFNRE